ncbi:MAG: NUDIX hydrolase [Pseudomonadota bacterium]
MSHPHLLETRLTSREVLRGSFLHAFQDQVALPDGSSSVREYIVHPGAAMVIALLPAKDGVVHVVLERQFRYPVNRVMVEFPAGKRDAAETSLVCAQRELREETGYSAAEWAHAGQLHPTIAYSTECIDIWFARNLRLGAQHLDAGEFLEVFTATPAELLTWCLDGTVTDGKTLAGALWLQNVLSGAWSLDWQSSTPTNPV